MNTSDDNDAFKYVTDKHDENVKKNPKHEINRCENMIKVRKRSDTQTPKIR